jgi:hypothetical protein
MAQMNGDVSLKDCLTDKNLPTSLVKADSQLGKAGMTGPPNSQLIVHPLEFVNPGHNKWQVIYLGEQIEPESAFVFLNKVPPRS